MDIDRIYHVSFRPPAVEDWSRIPGDRTAAFITPDSFPIPGGRLAPLTEIWTYRLDRARLETAISAAGLTLLSIAWSHVADLDFLQAQRGLRGLAINWNTKLGSLDFLGPMTSLEILSLQDLKHVHDLEPLAALANLRGLQIAGGMDTKMELATLAPLAGLASVEDLRLANVRIGDLGLAALAELPRLKRLSLPGNIAPQGEYARLAARMSGVRCAMFQPYVPIEGGPLAPDEDPVAALDRLGDARVVVTGKGLPTLRARTDRARLLRHCARFRAAA